MKSSSPKRAFLVKLENRRQPLDAEDCPWYISPTMTMMTVGLGHRDGPTLVSLYKPKNLEHELARTQLFEQAAVDCRKYPARGKGVHVRQAFDFIRDMRWSLPQDILHGLFEEQHKRFLVPGSGKVQFSEEFLMAYITSLEAAVAALETEGALAMFAEGEQVEVDSLTLRMYFPFSDAMEQQEIVDKAVQKEIDQIKAGVGNRVFTFRFLKSLSTPITHRLLNLVQKIRLYTRRTYQRFSDPFYSAKVFRRTLNQTNSWFFADEDRLRCLEPTKANMDAEAHRRWYHQFDWLFYERNAMIRALTTRDPKEERDFILKSKQRMMEVGSSRLHDYFLMFSELQERERQLSILSEVEAWVKRHCFK